MSIRISAVVGVTFSLFLMLNTFKCRFYQIEIPIALRSIAASQFDFGHSPYAQDDTLCYLYQIEIPISLRSMAATSIPQKPKGFRGPLRFDYGHSPYAQDDTFVSKQDFKCRGRGGPIKPILWDLWRMTRKLKLRVRKAGDS